MQVVRRILGWLVVATSLAAMVACGARASLDPDDPHPVASIVVFVGSGEQCHSDEGVTVRLTNGAPPGSSSVALTWSASVSASLVLAPTTPIPLTPGAFVDLHLKIAALATAHSGADLSGVLHLITNDPDHSSIDAPIQVHARGAEVVVPPTLDFGETAGAPATAITFQNVGDDPVDVKVALPKEESFFASSITAATIPANGSHTFHYGFKPNRPGLISEKLVVTVQGTLCGVAPHEIELRGRGFVGDARLSATILDFGLVDCGAQSTARTVELSNVGTAPFTFSATIGSAGGGFSVAPNAGTVPGGAKVMLTVTPAPVPIPSDVVPNGAGNVLSIDTSIANDAPHLVDLYQTPHGASLTFSASSLVLEKYQIGKDAATPIYVLNTGNASVTFDNRPTTNALYVWGTVSGWSSATLTVTTHDADRPEWIGSVLTFPFPLVVTGGGPVCKVVGGDTATFTGTAPVIQMAASSDLVCLNSGQGYVFCSGTNHFTFPGPAPTLPIGTFAMAYMRVPSGNGSLVVSDNAICIGNQCSIRDGSLSIPLVNPFGYALAGGDGAATALCGTIFASSLGCIGKNPFGTFGTGTTHASLSLVPEPAMIPFTEHLALAEHAGYAWVSSGTIRAAGLKQGGNLGTSSVPDGLVTTPLLVDVINDAQLVVPFANGACATRYDGSIWCWDTTHVPTPRGGYAGVYWGFVAIDYDHLYAISSPLQLSYFDGTNVTPIAGLNGDPWQLIGPSGHAVVRTSTGGIARLVNGVPSYLPGFDGL
ncbi:hypothetical protein BH09MYX1_BH09MYX1_29750 [soil metagenome]